MRTIELENDRIIFLDQTLLPGEMVYRECETLECLCEAIRSLRVRGAPLLGVAGGYGMALAAIKSRGTDASEVIIDLENAAKMIKDTRPTAVNLSWAVDRVLKAAKDSSDPIQRAVEEAKRIHKEDLEMNQRLERAGADLIRDGEVILTHCNAGSLATSGFGTALGVIKEASRRGKKVRVFADETRPLLQGARLTAFEMVQAGIPVTVITDSMAASVMAHKGVSMVIVGADRITRNGDTANKIGTYGLAILAKEQGIPFYVAAPYSTIDLETSSGEGIPVEERSRKEIEFLDGKRVVPAGADIYNPAFDVTPRRYVTAYITEKGVLRPPFRLKGVNFKYSG